MKEKTITSKYLNLNSKIYFVIIPLLSLATAMLIVFLFFKLNNTLHSDTAAEILLGREVNIEHSIFPRNWFYSTEIRVINIHLLIAPLLAITSNMILSKIIANIIIIILLVLCYFLLMNSMKVDKKYSLLLLPLLLTPLSDIWFDSLFSGAFYTPYLICIMIVISIINFLDNNNLRENKKQFLKYALILLSFTLGLTGIRFITNLYIPLFITQFFINLNWVNRKGKSRPDIKALWIKLKSSIPMYGMFFIGFVINKLFLTRILLFPDVITLRPARFSDLGSRFSLTIGTLFELFGIRVSPNTISFENIEAVIKFIFLAIAIFIAFKLLVKKDGLSRERKIFALFFAASFFINIATLTFTGVEITQRYHINSIVLIFPIIALYFEQYKNNLTTVKRSVLIVIIAICIIFSQYSVMYNALRNDINSQRHEVIKFLKESGLTFGYATFWNADIVTVLSNGEIEVASIDYSLDKKPYLWLTTKRYYNKNYHQGKTFLLLTKDEVKKVNPQLIEGARKLNEINGFSIYVFETNPYDFNLN